MWVQNAQRDHLDFMAKMRERGVEVVEMHALLAETLENPAAKAVASPRAWRTEMTRPVTDWPGRGQPGRSSPP